MGSTDGMTHSPLSYSNWGAHQPDNYLGVERCINVWTKNNFAWNDGNCAKEFCFVCEDRNL